MLVGQNRLIDRIPVDPGILAVREALLVHLEEQPLVPLVVLGVGRVDHARPVEGCGITAHRRALLIDVVVGPRDGIQVALDGGVLGRKAEGVPPDGVKHVIAAVAPVAGNDVAERIRFRVPHVQVPRGVGEHVEHVLARPVISGAIGTERFALIPDGKPLFLN